MRKNIAITGAKGTVGSALTETLGRRPSDYYVMPIDLPELDIRNTDCLQAKLSRADVVIHLAGVFGSAKPGATHWEPEKGDPINADLFSAVLAASRRKGVGQFIHASSVHAEDIAAGMARNQEDGSMLIASTTPVTTLSSEYGRGKRWQEKRSAFWLSSFVDGVVSLRLGGVRRNNRPPGAEEFSDPKLQRLEAAVWLEREDLGDLVSRIIDNPIPGHIIMNAVSDNAERFHDLDNPFGWMPVANSANI